MSLFDIFLSINQKTNADMKTIALTVLGIFVFFSCNELVNKQSPSSVNAKGMKMEVSEGANLLFDFENYKTGELPGDWSQSFTGKGKSTDWKIVDDNGNKVLAQLSSDNPNYHFNVAFYNDLVVKDVELEVRMKGVKGKMDQGGGFVWRYTDADNYYVVRANPLEDNVVLYKVVKGVRTDLPVLGKGRTYGVEVDKLGNGWNTLKLKAEGDLFTVYLNGKQLFQVKDNSISRAGLTGLWTKADAVTYFDDFRVRSLL